MKGFMEISSALRRTCFGIGIVVLCLAAYFPSLSNGFSSDDFYTLVENPWVRDWSGIREAFVSNMTGFTAEGGSNYYRPMMYVVFMGVHSIFGLNPAAYHAVNLIFHCAASVLVFLVAGRLQWNQRVPESDREAVGFLAALIFAVHPVHTEGVMWVSGLPDVACTAFCLLSLHIFLGAEAGKRNMIGYGLSLLAYAVGLLFKEPAASLPMVLVAIGVAGKGGVRGVSWPKVVPYAVVTVAYLAARNHALGSFSPYFHHGELNRFELSLNQMTLFSEYVVKFLVPLGLSPYYSFMAVRSVFDWKVIASMAVVALFILGAAWSYKREKGVFAGLMLFALPLSPVVVFMRSINGSIFADRFLYMPSAGLCLLSGYAIVRSSNIIPRRVVAAATVTILCLFFAAVVARAPAWKDDISLWGDALEKSGPSAMSHKCYALGLWRAARYQEAIPHYEKAAVLDPGDWTTWNNLGAAYSQVGNYASAVASYARAVELRPSAGMPFVGLGLAFLSLGRIDEAISCCTEAVERNDSAAAAHGCLGVIYGSTGYLDKAIAEFEIALRLDPGDVTSRENLAKAKAARGGGM